MKAFILLLTLCSSLAFGNPSYDWQKDRKRYALTADELTLSEYRILYRREYNYVWENNDLYLYETEHSIIRVTNAAAIEHHNRIYISMRNVIDVKELKARSISKDGKITVFDKENFKEIKDEDYGNTYRIFAIEGIEPDSEIEYFYTLKKDWSAYETAYFQFDTPLRNGTLLLTSPKKLRFDIKVYFDTAHVRLDTAMNQNHYAVSFAKIPATAKERFSFEDANRVRVESKLAFNLTQSNGRQNTWASAAKVFYKHLKKVDDKGIRQIESFVKTLGDDRSWSTEKRIRNVEEKIKSTIRINPVNDPAYAEVQDILKLKQASVEGITRVMVLVFEQLNIPYQIVMTCSRELKRFDGSFDSWTYLDDYLFYFPDTKAFLSPQDNIIRYPFVPTKFMANRGLFIEPIHIGKASSALAFINDIPALPYYTDKADHDVTVTFSPDAEKNIVKQRLTIVGLNAGYLAAYYNSLTQEERQKYIQSILDNYTISGITLTSWTVSTPVEKGLPHFIVDCAFTTPHFIETAGDKILFKVGELIGPQTELYREENRRTDIENVSNRGYDRVLKIQLPSGYQIKNPESLKMNVTFENSAATPFLFSSDYTVTGTTLTITITEFYKEIGVPKSRYEDFRKVVNASADFNKIVLVLEKTNR